MTLPAHEPKEPELQPAQRNLATLPVEIQRKIYSYFITPWSLQIIGDRGSLLYTEATFSSEPRNWVSPADIPGHELVSTCRVIREIVGVLQQEAFDGHMCVDQIFKTGPEWLFSPWLAHVQSLYYVAHIKIEPRSLIFWMKHKNVLVRQKQFASMYIRLMSKLKYARYILVENHICTHRLPSATKMFTQAPMKVFSDMEIEAEWQMLDLLQHSRSSTNPHGIEKADFQFFQFWNGWHKECYKNRGMEIMVSYQNETFTTLDVAVKEIDGSFFLWQKANPWQVLVHSAGPDGYDRPFGNVPTEFQWVVSLTRNVAREMRDAVDREEERLLLEEDEIYD